jgi:hypothetical protein
VRRDAEGLGSGFRQSLAMGHAMLLADEESDVGHFGWRSGWDTDLYSELRKVGYPSNIKSGEVIQVERGPVSVKDGLVELRHGNPLSGGGSSGGAWIGDYTISSESPANYIVSVTSFSYNGRPDVDYGPYFDSDFRKLLDHVRGGCN